MKNQYPKGKPKPQRTALDDLLSAERKEKQYESDELYSQTDDDRGNESESSGQGTRFLGHTGIFSLDFPQSPHVSKGKGKKVCGKKSKECPPTSEISNSE